MPKPKKPSIYTDGVLNTEELDLLRHASARSGISFDDVTLEGWNAKVDGDKEFFQSLHDNLELPALRKAGKLQFSDFVSEEGKARMRAPKMKAQALFWDTGLATAPTVKWARDLRTAQAKLHNEQIKLAKDQRKHVEAVRAAKVAATIKHPDGLFAPDRITRAEIDVDRAPIGDD